MPSDPLAKSIARVLRGKGAKPNKTAVCYVIRLLIQARHQLAKFLRGCRPAGGIEPLPLARLHMPRIKRRRRDERAHCGPGEARGHLSRVGQWHRSRRNGCDQRHRLGGGRRPRWAVVGWRRLCNVVKRQQCSGKVAQQWVDCDPLAVGHRRCRRKVDVVAPAEHDRVVGTARPKLALQLPAGRVTSRQTQA